jgi:AcrR family transcriptional regulator
MTGSRDRLSRSTVVAAACELLDELGPEGLTMTALGERLGVTGMALYRHIENRSALEIRSPVNRTKGAVDAALDDLAKEQRDHWRVAAKELGRYSDDALFADVVTDAIARLRRQGARRQSSRSTRASRFP